MAYVKYLKTNEILIYEERHGYNESQKLGDMLFSFLELDLNEYNSLYTFCSKNSFDQVAFKMLREKYPKTAQRYKSLYNRDDFICSDDCFLEFLFCNQDSFSDLYEHPYLYYSDTIMEGAAGTFSSEFYNADFFRLQSTIKELVEFCLMEINNPKLNSLTPMERYYILTATKHERFRYILNLHTSVLFFPMALHDDILDKYVYNSSSHEDISLDEIPDDIIDQVKGNGEAVLVNKCNTAEDFCFFEFYTLLSRNIAVKRCANCGRLFISSGKYNTDCCDRIPKGEKYSCKKIMAQKRRKKKINSNPIVKEYERAYKRNYARVTNHKMNAEDFRLWSEEATQKRDAFSAEYNSNPSDQLISEFKKYLGNK